MPIPSTRAGLSIAALLLAAAAPLAAQTATKDPDAAATTQTALDEAAARATETCTWSHGGGQLAAALCQPGLAPEIWAAAGRAACDGHDLCAAWIYDDAAAQPDPVPGSFDGLTQDNVTSALAVWVHEDAMLVTIAPVPAE